MMDLRGDVNLPDISHYLSVNVNEATHSPHIQLHTQHTHTSHMQIPQAYMTQHGRAHILDDGMHSHTQHAHTSQLDRHSSQLDRHSSQLERHASQLDRHSSQLDRHTSQRLNVERTQPRLNVDRTQSSQTSMTGMETQATQTTQTKSEEADIEEYFRVIGNDVVCLVCRKALHRSKIHTHLRMHTADRPYECDTCKKRFTRSDKLALHKKIHSGERPYHCFCGKKFLRLDHFKTHVATHNLTIEVSQALIDEARSRDGSRPVESAIRNFLVCPFCNSKFVQNFKYKRHLRFHTGEKPFHCCCGAKYARSERLYRHLCNYPDHWQTEARSSDSEDTPLEKQDGTSDYTEDVHIPVATNRPDILLTNECEDEKVDLEPQPQPTQSSKSSSKHGTTTNYDDIHIPTATSITGNGPTNLCRKHARSANAQKRPLSKPDKTSENLPKQGRTSGTTSGYNMKEQSIPTTTTSNQSNNHNMEGVVVMGKSGVTASYSVVSNHIPQQEGIAGASDGYQEMQSPKEEIAPSPGPPEISSNPQYWQREIATKLADTYKQTVADYADLLKASSPRPPSVGVKEEPRRQNYEMEQQMEIPRERTVHHHY